MIHDFHLFLYQHRFWVVAITALPILYYGRIALLALVGADRKPGRPEMGRGVRPQGPLIRPRTSDAGGAPGPLDAGMAGRLNRGNAKTDKIRPVDANLPRATTESQRKTEPMIPTGPGSQGAELVRKANRLEELGFHIGIESDPAPAPTPAPGTTATTPGNATTVRSQAAVSANAPAHPSTPPALNQGQPGAGIAAPPAPAPAAEPAATGATDAAKTRRLSELGLAPAPADTRPATADFDDILARLDQVLSSTEEAPQAAAGTPGASAAPAAPPVGKPAFTDGPKPMTVAIENKKKAPVWARQDAFDEDVDAAAKAGPAKGASTPTAATAPTAPAAQPPSTEPKPPAGPVPEGQQLGLFDDKAKPPAAKPPGSP